MFKQNLRIVKAAVIATMKKVRQNIMNGKKHTTTNVLRIMMVVRVKWKWTP